MALFAAKETSELAVVRASRATRGRSGSISLAFSFAFRLSFGFSFGGAFGILPLARGLEGAGLFELGGQSLGLSLGCCHLLFKACQCLRLFSGGFWLGSLVRALRSMPPLLRSTYRVCDSMLGLLPRLSFKDTVAHLYKANHERVNCLIMVGRLTIEFELCLDILILSKLNDVGEVY